MDRMDKNLVGLERAQEEFHQAFDNHMEDVEDELLVLKMDVDVFGIWMMWMEKDVDILKDSLRDVEMSVDNSHLCLEKVEDCVDGFIESLRQYSLTSDMASQSLGMEIQRVQKEWRKGHEDILAKFKRMGNVIDKKFVQLDEELERVIDLVGQKIDAKFGEFSAEFLEVMEIEDNQRNTLEERVLTLEQRLWDMVMLLSSLNTQVMELEDSVMEEADAKGEEVESSSSSDFGPVENMVAIPIPAPTVMHTLILIPDAYISLSVHSSPSPPYV